MIPAAPPAVPLTPNDAERQRIAARNAVALQAAWLVALVLRRLRHVADVRRADAADDDVRQACWLELVRAADLYDPAKGRLSTIAFRRVRDAALAEAMRSATVVHVPPRVLAAMWRGDEPTADLKQRMECAETARTPTKVVEDDEPSLAYNTQPGRRRQAEIAEADKTVGHLLHWLSPRNREIVRLYFGLGSYGGEQRSMTEIGKRVGLSGERVRQIIGEALQQMRAAAPVACPHIPVAAGHQAPRPPAVKMSSREVEELAPA